MLVHEFLEQSADRYPDKTAVVSGEDRITSRTSWFPSESKSEMSSPGRRRARSTNALSPRVEDWGGDGRLFR